MPNEADRARKAGKAEWLARRAATRNFVRDGIGVLTGPHGEEFFVDLDVFARVRGALWCASETEPDRFYAKNNALGYLHKLVVSFALVDHINRNTFDNRRENLRDGSGGVNSANTNKRRGCKTQFRWVYQNRQGRFFAEITLNYVRHYLGSFDTPEEASRVVQDFAKAQRPGVAHAE